MSIGLIPGRNSEDESQEKNYKLVNKCQKNFKDKFNSYNCRELLNCDIGTDAGQEYFVENDLFETCYGFTEEATRITLTLLNENSN